MTDAPAPAAVRGGPPGARSRSAQARAELRRDVVAAVRDGMSRSQAAHRFGISRRTVGIWARTFRGPIPDVARDLVSAPAVAPQLTGIQELTVLRLMWAVQPSLLGLDGHLWTRRSVAEIIRIETGHRPSLATVDHYLSRWGLVGPAVATPRGSGPRAVRLSCHRIVAPSQAASVAPPAEEAWQALVAESGHGAVHFRLSAVPFSTDNVRVFGRHLAQQHLRPVALLVWRWPENQRDVLDAWRADPGPGLTITDGPAGRY